MAQLLKRTDKIPTDAILKTVGTPSDATDVKIEIGVYMSKVTYMVPIKSALKVDSEPKPELEKEPVVEPVEPKPKKVTRKSTKKDIE